MITREQIFRALQTIAVPVLVGLVARQIWGDQNKETTPPSLYLPLLADIDFVPRNLPVTYRDVPDFDAFGRVSALQLNGTTAETPDVTAVVLNWSRFPNVMLITSLLCGPWLEGTIAEVLIWNNSPRKLAYEDFKTTGCPKSKLRIHNAPYNVLFQARYLACAQANTKHCFIQDDDYLVRSEIVQALYARITEPGAPSAVHLLPPHEHLSTTLREIHVPAQDDSAYISDIHTSFAWLGHGTMLRRSEAQNFLGLLRYLKATSDEMKMADNFFTILSNRVPEVWFDQGFELGGGLPFTVGSEGDERNKNYTLRATQYLESLTRCGHASCDVPVDGAQHARSQLPYITLDPSYTSDRRTRAACRGAACVLATNIRTLPAQISHTASHARDILASEVKNAAILGEPGKENYLEHPLSNAVDMKTATVFRSLNHATQGDMLLLDTLSDIGNAQEWTTVELVWLVDMSTESILRFCTFEWSADSITWTVVSHTPVCYDTNQEAAIDGAQVPLRECSVQMLHGSSALHLRATGRYFRARLGEDQDERWTISEMWLRGF